MKLVQDMMDETYRDAPCTVPTKTGTCKSKGTKHVTLDTGKKGRRRGSSNGKSAAHSYTVLEHKRVCPKHYKMFAADPVARANEWWKGAPASPESYVIIENGGKPVEQADVGSVSASERRRGNGKGGTSKARRTTRRPGTPAA